MNPQDPDRLETSIHRILRSVPDRRAPAGLQGRVLAEIARRQALPWWRKSFAHWPAAVRALFFGGSAIVAALVVSGLLLVWYSSGAAGMAGASEPFAWIRAARDFLTSTNSSLHQVYAAIPRLWLFGAAAVIASLYALLGAISATAYRAISYARHTA
jgi:hypothetical protein